MWNGSSLAALDIPLGHRYAESHIAKLSARSAPAHLRSPRLLIGGIAGAMLSRRPRATQWTSELRRQVSQGCCDEASGAGAACVTGSRITSDSGTIVCIVSNSNSLRTER